MRPGDLVEFKDGLFGIQAPRNLGIFLERRKRKKDYFAVLVTVKGTKEVKPEQLTKRRFHAAVDPAADEADLVARLGDLIAQAGSGKLETEPEAGEGPSERELWERLVGHGTEPRSVEAWAALLHEREPTKGEVRRIGDVLERCRRPGVGFFERAERGLWAPIGVDERKAFQHAMEAVGRLRRALVRVEEVEDDSGETWERLLGIDPDQAGLDQEARALLEQVGAAMADAVLYDRWRDEVTAPGARIHTLAGQQYHRALDHLARDWTGVVTTSRSSILVQFLVDTRLVSVQDAIRLIAQRRVLATPGMAWTTPDDVEARADKAAAPEDALRADQDAYAHREDLRELETYTIDPPDAKDFDDAVSLRMHDDGSATLWVHIADVSHYVQKDDLLDRHARERATSVYLPTGVLPMLPHRLSDDLCSLREATDRFAMTVRLDVASDGTVTAETPMESVIRVDRNLSYHDVDGAIERKERPFHDLNALAERMRALRRGLDIETGELRIRFAEEAAQEAARRERLEEDDAATAPAVPGAPGNADPVIGLHIQVKHGSPATRLIETFMVAANEAVSRFVARNGVPVPYRCHPLPERAKAERFTAQAKVIGIDVAIELPERAPGTGTDDGDDEADDEGPSILEQLASGKMQLGGFAASETVGSRRDDDGEDEDDAATAKPGDDKPSIVGLAQLDDAEREAWLAPFREALARVEAVEDEGLRGLAYMKMLGTLGRAFYTPRNLGHFGLGSVSYAHFTSPIRRYPDLVLHRQLRWVLRREKGLSVPDEPPHAGEHLESLCEISSRQAEAAERLERDLLACCMTFESRRPEWNEALRAMVNGVAPGGVFLTLPGELEARLSMRDLPGGPYEADEYGAYLFRAVLPGGRGAHAEPDAEEAARLADLPWRELEDPDSGELREVRIRLGDRVRVRIRERDFVEGKVAVSLSGGAM